MATPNVGILTTAGKALIDKVNSGQAKISFSKVVFSSMDNSQLSDTQIKALTAIAPQEVVVSSPETTLDTNSGETRIRATGTNEKLADGVYVKTYGVFAKDDTGNEILYGVTVSPNPNYFPAYDGVTPQAVTYSYKTVIQETSNITMTSSNDVYVSQEDLDEALKPLPKDDSVVHLTGNETIAGTKTFVTAPIDQKSGLPYITKAGVPDVPATLADTTKDTNFQESLQVKGVSVATSDDLKSVQLKMWHEIELPDMFTGSPILMKYNPDDQTTMILGAKNATLDDGASWTGTLFTLPEGFHWISTDSKMMPLYNMASYNDNVSGRLYNTKLSRNVISSDGSTYGIWFTALSRSLISIDKPYTIVNSIQPD